MEYYLLTYGVLPSHLVTDEPTVQKADEPNWFLYHTNSETFSATTAFARMLEGKAA